MTWETLQEMELGWVEGVVERISGEERRVSRLSKAESCDERRRLHR